MPGAGRCRPLVAVTLAVLASVAGWAASGSGIATASARSTSGLSTSGRSTSARPAPVDTVTAFANLSGSATLLQLDATTLAKWKEAGVTVGPAGRTAAVEGGAGLELPITSGYVESHSDRAFKPSYLLGSIDHFGSGLVFATTSTSVEATDLVFDLGDSMVYATIGTTENVPLFSLARRDLHLTRSGRTLQISGALLDLTPTGAAELDALFHTAAVTEYTEIAATEITATGQVSRYRFTPQTAEYPRLSGIALSLDFTGRALATFNRLGVTPSPTGSASYDAKSAKLSFPITGGTAIVHPDRHGQPGSLGGVVLDWGNGLTLAAGSTSVAMTDLTLVPSTSTIYASINGGEDNGALFSVKHAKSRLTLKGGNLNLRGALLDLTPSGAAMLDGVFHTTDFRPNAEWGTLTLVGSGG